MDHPALGAASLKLCIFQEGWHVPERSEGRGFPGSHAFRCDSGTCHPKVINSFSRGTLDASAAGCSIHHAPPPDAGHQGSDAQSDEQQARRLRHGSNMTDG